MEYSKYGSNSDQAKMEQVSSRDGAALRPVPKDDYVPQRTSWFKEFIKGDVENAKRNVVRDVVFPFIKRMIIDSANVFLTSILDNVAGGPRKRTDYSSISRSNYTYGRTVPAPEPEEPQNGVFMTCYSESNGSLEVMLDVFRDIIERTGKLTVTQYYDQFKEVMPKEIRRNPSYDNNFGWTDLASAYVKYNHWDGNYYIANMGRPKFLG